MGIRKSGVSRQICLRSVLTCSTVLACAAAAVASSGASAAVTRTHKAAPARHAAAAPAHKRPDHVEAGDAENVVVRVARHGRDGGGGMMRVESSPHTVQTVTKQFINMRAPTSTALDLIQNLPSVSVSRPDSSGMQGGMIQARGLTDQDMALMVDNAPAAGAKYLSENIDSENLESVSVTPGSSGTDLPVMSAAGGVMSERSHTAASKFGGMMDFSYGTNNLSREFVRLDSGEIGHSGVKGYLSFSNSHARSWMGAGINQRRHIDFGLQKDWKNGSTRKSHRRVVHRVRL